MMIMMMMMIICGDDEKMSKLRTKVFRWNSSTDSRRRSLFLQFHFAHGSSLNIWNLFLMRILLRAIYISMPLTWKNRQNYPLVWLELSAIWQAGPGFNFHIYWKRLCVSSLLTFPPANRKPIQMRTLCTLCICKTHILKPIQTRISLSCLVSQLPFRILPL